MLNPEVPIREQLLSLDDAGAELPGDGGLSTVTRWAVKGIRFGDEQLRLKTVIIRRERFTTRAALAEFLTRMAELQACNVESPKKPERRQPIQGAPSDDELKHAGLL